jgi:large subunit ribosomal protein L30
MVYLVVRMKGTVNVPHWANLTLENLHLNKKFRATIIPENDQTLGMLRKVKEHVSWTSIDKEFIKEFIEKKGRLTELNPRPKPTATESKVNDINNKGGKSIDEGENKTSLNFDFDKIATDISQNQTYLSKIKGIKPWFALNPPRGGFKKKSKRSFSQDGILGENKELVSLVRRMM